MAESGISASVPDSRQMKTQGQLSNVVSDAWPGLPQPIICLTEPSFDPAKRTQVFAFGSKINNNKQQNANFNNNPVYSSGIGSTAATLAKGLDPQVFAVGMSHQF